MGPPILDGFAAVAGMTEEEAYYWFSKMTDHDVGRRSQKAMRILLAKE